MAASAPTWLLLRAGRVGSAIALALLLDGVRRLIIHDTDASRVSRPIELLGEAGRGRVGAGPADPTGCDMVCNATPLGMADADPLPVAPHVLASSMFVGDVIAGLGVTALVAAARAVGCNTASGDQMVEAVQESMLDLTLTTP